MLLKKIQGATRPPSGSPLDRPTPKVPPFVVRCALHVALSTLVKILPVLRAVAFLVPGSRKPNGTVLLTGTFFSDNWILNKIIPISHATRCQRVIMVSLDEVPEVPKGEWVRPPVWLCSLLGGTPARLMVYAYLAFKIRPDIVAGFHIMPNALVAATIAPLIRSRSVYLSVGGITEIEGGGVGSGNRLFQSIVVPDLSLERKLVKAINLMDMVVAKGPGTIRFLEDRGVKVPNEIIAGGIDKSPYLYENEEKIFDVVMVSRLVEGKRVDILLRAIKHLLDQDCSISAVLVGSGPDEADLKQMAEDLAISNAVTFAGFQADVAWWLKRSKIFVLISESEGLSMAMLEGMLSGLPACRIQCGRIKLRG